MGRVVRCTDSGIEYETDPKCRNTFFEYFGQICNSHSNNAAKKWQLPLETHEHIVRELLGRQRVVWIVGWQSDHKYSHVFSDGDLGGSYNDQRSLSGCLSWVGEHCIKKWTATQGAYALRSSEAELRGIVEAVARAKVLPSLARGLGFGGLSKVVQMDTGSSAAESFVCRYGLGRMRHLKVRRLVASERS